MYAHGSMNSALEGGRLEAGRSVRMLVNYSQENGEWPEPGSDRDKERQMDLKLYKST